MTSTYNVLRNEMTDSSDGGGGGDTSAPAAPSKPPSNPFSSNPPEAPASQIAPTEPKVEPKVEPVTPPAEPQTPTPTDPKSPEAPLLTADALAEALKKSGAFGNQPPPQAPQQPQMSAEEFNKKFNVFQVTPEVYKSILGVDAEPEQVQALNSTLQGISKQAVTVARHVMQQQMEQVQKQYAPMVQAFRDQTAKAADAEFVNSNPDLKDYLPVVREVTASAKSRGMTFNTLAEANKFVADKTRELMKLGPQRPVAAAPQASAPAKAVQTPMTPVSMGGRSGQGGTATPSKSLPERLFG